MMSLKHYNGITIFNAHGTIVTSLWWLLWHDIQGCYDSMISVPNKECGEMALYMQGSKMQ